LGQLFSCLKAKGCLVIGSDLLVKAGSCGNYYFPDLVIVCQKDEYETSTFGLKALLNPEIIFEILSDATEAFDRTFKLDCYKTIPGFRKYVLVHSMKKKVEIITKLSDAEWLSHTYEKPEEEIDLEGCKILLGEIYGRMEF
jgi:Uma2 family endonuclease